MHYHGKLIDTVLRKHKQKLFTSMERPKSSSMRLTVNEIKAAERVILICVQQRYFPEEVKALQKQGQNQDI